MKKTLYFLVLFIPIFAFSQNFIGLEGGYNYGGPIPSKIDSNSSAKIYPGFVPAFSFGKVIAPKLRASVRFSVSKSEIDYASTLKADTFISQYIFKFKIVIPTYYNAEINGKMKYTNFNSYLVLNYELFRFLSMETAVFYSYNLIKSDTLNVKVVIGEGGFFSDIRRSVNNSQNIRNTNWGIRTGFIFRIYKGLYFNVSAERHFLGFYDKNLPNNQPDPNPFHHTQVDASIGYRLEF